MADDPRIEPLARELFAVSRPSWSWDRPSTVSHEAQQAYWRDKARALLDTKVDPVDPLRALLADDDRAVEIGAEAAVSRNDRLGRARQSARAKDAYRDQVRPAIAAVLAALREVAGL